MVNKKIAIIVAISIVAIGTIGITYYITNKDTNNNKTQSEVTQAAESPNAAQNTKVGTSGAAATSQLPTAQNTVAVATPAQKPIEKTPATESAAPSTSITKKASPAATTEGTKSTPTTKPSTKSKASISSKKKVNPAPTEPKADANGFIYTKEQAIKIVAAEWKKLKNSGDYNYTGALEEAKNLPDFTQESFDADYKQMTTNPYSSKILTIYFDDYRGGGDLGTLIGECVGWLAVGGDDGDWAEYGAE